MGIIYFDICSIPLFLIILFVCYSRKMTKGAANQLFILLIILSMFSAVADLGIEIADNMVPLPPIGVFFCTFSTYVYMILRNATNVVLLLFLLSLTRTSFLLKSKWAKILFFLPYISILVMLIQNPFTNSAFFVSAETGYERRPLMFVFYGIALVYGLVGLIYCVYCFRYLPLNKWLALLSIYVLGHAAVLIQFFYPELLLEIFCTAIGEMLVMLSIMRPEERMDSEVGTLSWASYQSDIKNIILSKEHVQIICVQLSNSQEIRNYLGDHEYNRFIYKISEGIRFIRWKRQHHIELYFEKPGTFYLIIREDEIIPENIRDILVNHASDKIQKYTDMGVRFEPLVCIIRCPDDLKKSEDIINIGHKFSKIGSCDELTFYASEIVKSRTFAIESHIEEILDTAIKNKTIEMYYQPIYDIKTDSFHAAEALARIIDSQYGLIPPGIFIPAAESLGLMIPIGDIVLEHSFRFISEHNLNELGLSFIEINLSVAQCVDSSLPDKILALQEKYHVDPKHVNLEITETTFENISEVMLKNVNKLIEMGYSFSLDDYGVGYSSVQRVSSIPFKLVKIDKSILDEAVTMNGKMILEHTIQMMQSIGKKLVCEGAETIEQVELLKQIKGDYIQGFYFSRPIPASDFIKYIKKNIIK